MSSTPSSTSSSSATSHSRPKVSDVPEGTFLLPWIWKLDPASSAQKAVLLGSTVVGLVCLWHLRYLVAPIFPQLVESHWDERHGIIPVSSSDVAQNINTSSYDCFGCGALPSLTAVALDLPEAWVEGCFKATAAFVVCLVVADVILGLSSKQSTDPFPASWKTENTRCYHDMFSEPTRFGRLLRHPGNTLSNAPYLLASLCVLASCYRHSSLSLLWWADLQFGIMLFLLAITSCLWHGSNGPWTQYVDIWSMNCCIPYLVVRNLCGLGLLKALVEYTTVELALAKQVTSLVCAVIYGVMIVTMGHTHFRWYQTGYLHGNCPFSVRARLLGISKRHGSQGHEDIGIVDVAAFAAMPLFSYGLIVLLQIFHLKSLGSFQAGETASRTLVFGWIYRFWDRWLLDGYWIMNYVNDTMRPSWARTVVAAILSPTAVLHLLTGITLLAGYVHSRSLEEQF